MGTTDVVILNTFLAKWCPAITQIQIRDIFSGVVKWIVSRGTIPVVTICPRRDVYDCL